MLSAEFVTTHMFMIIVFFFGAYIFMGLHYITMLIFSLCKNFAEKRISILIYSIVYCLCQVIIPTIISVTVVKVGLSNLNIIMGEPFITILIVMIIAATITAPIFFMEKIKNKKTIRESD